MNWLSQFWLRLQTLFLRRRSTRQLDAELQFHLDQQVAENVASGMSPEEARYAAMRLFGNTASLKESTEETWGWTSLEQFARDLRYSLRALRRTPGFALITILLIALGIGATTSLFTIVRSVLLEPLPFKDPSRLLRLYEHSADGKFPFNDSAGGVFTEWKKQSHSFSALAILDAGFGYGLSGTGGELPERVTASESSWDVFPTLASRPRWAEPSRPPTTSPPPVPLLFSVGLCGKDALAATPKF